MSTSCRWELLKIADSLEEICDLIEEYNNSDYVSESYEQWLEYERIRRLQLSYNIQYGNKVIVGDF